MDFIAGLLKFKGYEAIFVVVDRLSKYCHFIPLKHPYIARSLADGKLLEMKGRTNLGLESENVML